MLNKQSAYDRVRGLDTIRAVCAFWVVMGHFGGPPVLAGIDRSTWVGWLIGGIFNNFWSGPSAVIVFFVISGFCIHYPYAKTLLIPSIGEYGLRRYFRIGIPLVVVTALSPLIGIKLSMFHDDILWSLVAELVYYTLYPALLMVRQKGVSWRIMLGVSFVMALVLVATNPIAGNYPSWGLYLNWVLGLPCWIAGCFLAENVAQSKPAVQETIWRWRFAVWLTSVVCSVLRFHSPIGYPWTLNFFALLVAIWLAKEIDYHSTRNRLGWLENAGKWSYSVYLAHVPANKIFQILAIPNLGYLINWSAKMIFILGVSYMFYLLVERPSHMVARKLGKSIACWNMKSNI